MKDYKRVKDPIYGYIKIPVAYMTNIVDTAVFQRLRRIIQIIIGNWRRNLWKYENIQNTMKKR